jgi:purine nucleoside permease
MKGDIMENNIRVLADVNEGVYVVETTFQSKDGKTITYKALAVRLSENKFILLKSASEYDKDALKKALYNKLSELEGERNRD